MRAIVIVGVVGCAGTAPAVTTGDADSPYDQTLPSGPCAVEGVTGTVAGVTLAIRSDSCVYRRGQPASFRYEVTTDAAVPALVVPGSGGSCGPCELHSTDPGSWVRWSIGGSSPAGELQRYCLCDVGCCPPTQDQTIQLGVATASHAIDWSGRTWSGPSDTGTPQGDFFVPGRYAVAVTFVGFASGEVRAELPIEVIAP